VVGELVDEDAGQHDPRPAADAENGRDQPDAARDPLARELVANDPEGQRKHPAADALHDPAGDQHRQGRGQRGQQRSSAKASADSASAARVTLGCCRSVSSAIGGAGGMTVPVARLR
jgi:hypothetical protein